jgi:hypothetical protein
MDEITKETPRVKAFIGYLYDRDYEAPIKNNSTKEGQGISTAGYHGAVRSDGWDSYTGDKYSESSLLVSRRDPKALIFHVKMYILADALNVSDIGYNGGGSAV